MVEQDPNVEEPGQGQEQVIEPKKPRHLELERLPPEFQVAVDAYLRAWVKKAWIVLVALVTAVGGTGFILTFMGVKSVSNNAELSARVAVDSAVDRLREGRLKDLEQDITDTTRRLRDGVDDLKQKAITALVEAKTNAEGASKVAKEASTLAGKARTTAQNAEEQATATQVTTTKTLELAKEQERLLPRAAAFLEKASEVQREFKRIAALVAEDPEFQASITKTLEKVSIPGPRGPVGPQGPSGPRGAGIPVGAVVAWPGPFTKQLEELGWALCNGAAYPTGASRQALDDALDNTDGKRYGKGQLPDYRGFFLRGANNGRVDRAADPDASQRLSYDGHSPAPSPIGSVQFRWLS